MSGLERVELMRIANALERIARSMENRQQIDHAISSHVDIDPAKNHPVSARMREEVRRAGVWVDHDDGHAGGYPHQCDTPNEYNRSSWPDSYYAEGHQ